ncbi:MAG: hypothetical protein N3B18_07470 [Desulfobacterota bacterium]|nr:hypothetical protein [Thermodesulfobacteriota bacterium]
MTSPCLLQSRSSRRRTLGSIFVGMVLAVVACGVSLRCAGAGGSGIVFDRTGIDITRALHAGMRVNADNSTWWSRIIANTLHDVVFSEQTAAHLRSYHVILIPGGEFDAASELLRYCEEGALPVELSAFFDRNPTTRRDVEAFLDNYICPEPDALRTLYNTLLGTFRTYESVLAAHGIAVTRLDYFAPEGPTRIGDRIGKLDLIARTIEQLDNGTRRFILIGHSFGGLNICDFLVELCNGHRPGMPEWKFFSRTRVRSWSDEKKASVLRRIAAAVFLNSFLQGNLSNERRLEKKAATEGLNSPDPVGEYIQQVLTRAGDGAVSTEDYIADDATHLALITARYRTGYYLAGRNTADGSTTAAVRDALRSIAARMPLVSICCRVPSVLPYLRVGINLLVYTAQEKWEAERHPNDGAVNTYGGIFPMPEALYAVFHGMDHGTLVMRPDLRVVTSGSAYDQVPFIKTLLSLIASRLQDNT